MEWLNYHHLLYFWVTVREGGVAPAARRLRLAHPTVSGQVRALEEAVGEKLLARQGRRLVLTDVGRVVYGYAEEIFSIGRELQEALRGKGGARPTRLVVGIAEVVPKLVAKRLMDPARAHDPALRIVCREDKTDRLFADLASHELDVVVSDTPLPSGSGVRAFNHLLGESGVTFFGVKALAARHRAGFPQSLDGAPMLLPSSATTLRRSIDAWLDDQGVRPAVVAEFDDSALMKVFGQDGAGLFPSPTVIEDAVRRQYDVEVVARVPDVRERFYAVTPERRIRNAAVAAISDAARREVFS